MNEFVARLKAYLSRQDVRSQKTQLSLSALVAVVILVAAVIAWPSSDKATTTAAGEVSSEDADGSSLSPSETGSAIDETSTPGSRRGRSSVSAAELRAATPGAKRSVSRTGIEAFGPGITADKIYIGSYYTKNQGAANAALGAGGLDQGDARKPQNVVINDLNKRGGLAGRKMIPIYHGYDANSTETNDQMDQAACAQFFQDNKVFVSFLSGGVMDECVKKAGAMNLGTGGALPEDYKKYPHRIDPSALNLIRLGNVTVSGLASKGYFDKGARIGMITWDEPRYRASIADGFVPALKKLGLKLATPVSYAHSPASVPEVSQSSADVSSAVLRFQSQDITHVMILDGQSGVCGGGCLSLEWYQNTNSQRYYPRLGLNDSNAPKEWKDLGVMSDEVAHRSITVSWTDFDASYDEGWHLNESREKCYKLMRDNGVDISNPNAQAAALLACEDVWFLELAVSKLPGPLTVDNMVKAIESLGYSYTSPSSYGNFFSPERHDGTAAVRIFRFVDSCRCFKYFPGAPLRV